MAETLTQLYYNGALGTTKATVVVGPAAVYSVNLVNVASNAITFLQFFDALAADVTVGTTAPTFVLQVDAAASSHSTVLDISRFAPFVFHKGCVVAATTTATGATGPSTGVFLTLQYR